jgi:hypothetical protein
LKLGPTEFKLLHYLMNHAERVHSRAQLLDKVWGDHVFIEERTVDVHVKRCVKPWRRRVHGGNCAGCWLSADVKPVAMTVGVAPEKVSPQPVDSAPHECFGDLSPLFFSRLVLQVWDGFGVQSNERASGAGFALGGGLTWFVMDSLRACACCDGCAVPAATDLSFGNGLWGEAHDRVRRLLRRGSRMTLESDNRLKIFWRLCRHLPMVLYCWTSKARIEWFNQTAANILDLIRSVTCCSTIGNLVRDPGFRPICLRARLSA